MSMNKWKGTNAAGIAWNRIAQKGNKKEILCELCLPNGIAKHPFHWGDSSEAGGEKMLYSLPFQAWRHYARKIFKKFANLRTDKNKNRYPEATCHRAPHKPILLLSVMDLIEQVVITQNFIEPSHDYTGGAYSRRSRPR